MPTVTSILGTIPKWLVMKLEDLERNRDTPLRRVLETWGDLLSLKRENPSVNAGAKNSFKRTTTAKTIIIKRECSREKVLDDTRLDGQGDQLGMVQEI